MAKSKKVSKVLSELSQIGYQYHQIRILGFNLEDPKDLLPEMQFTWGVENRHILHKEKSIVVVIVEITIQRADNDSVLGRVSVEHQFLIDDVAKLEPTGPIQLLPEPFAILLNGLTVSTTRGVLHGILRGTYLNNAVLPILDPRTFSVSEPE